jgi:hypothetical protein
MNLRLNFHCIFCRLWIAWNRTYLALREDLPFLLFPSWLRPRAPNQSVLHLRAPVSGHERLGLASAKLPLLKLLHGKQEKLWARKQRVSKSTIPHQRRFLPRLFQATLGAGLQCIGLPGNIYCTLNLTLHCINLHPM